MSKGGLITYVQSTVWEAEEWTVVDRIARTLRAGAELKRPETLESIRTANRPRGASQVIQDAFGPAAKSLDIERRLLFTFETCGHRCPAYAELQRDNVVA